MKKDTTNLIGQEIVVVESTNVGLVGKKGVVVDETKNMLAIEHQGTIKKIIKNEVTIKVQNKTINGEKLIGKLEERIKK